MSYYGCFQTKKYQQPLEQKKKYMHFDVYIDTKYRQYVYKHKYVVSTSIYTSYIISTLDVIIKLDKI